MNTSHSLRQLIIGLDAMEWDLVRKWAAAGKLPIFARLMREGAQAELSSVADRLPDTSWQCLCSGLNPAYLERYFYVQDDPVKGGMRYLPDDRWGVKFFWDLLSDAGRQVGVLEIPHTCAAEELKNGFQISWGTHGAHGPRFSTPESLLREVDQRFGRHPVGECDSATSDRERKALVARLLEGVRAHGELFRNCITERDWEVLIAVFAAPHCAGHLYWHDMDSAHPQHDPANRNRLAGAIEDVYRAIDREVGAMIECAGPNLRVYVVSPLGMGPLFHASWNLPDMLDRWGYGSEAESLKHMEKTARAEVNIWRILRMLIPGKLQYAIYDALPKRLQHELMFRFYRGNRSWKRCRAFAIPNNDVVGAIRINLKGRDRNGIAEPGGEYQQICDDVCAALAELKDPVSGRPVADRITQIQKDLRGPYLDQLPDITVRWDASFPWSAVHSPRFGTLQIRSQDSRKGSHTTHGFLIAAGDGIPRGATISGASIYDFVPTIMAAAGLRAPAACEGRPLFSDG